MERIVYQEWIVALGRDPSLPPQSTENRTTIQNTEIIAAVRAALDRLDETEIEFIRSFYFQGLGYREISGMMGKATHRLESIHRGALLKLRVLLSGTTGGYFKTRAPVTFDCPLCRHPRRSAIDSMIRQRRPTATWRHIIKKLKTDYGLPGITPQRLIGHRKYHMIKQGS